jgi:hypothetical protein
MSSIESVEPQKLFESVQTLVTKSEMPERHTFFQMKNFIVGKECTVQGQLWQITRELRSRSESLVALQDQIAETQDNIELLNIATERLRLPIKAVMGIEVEVDELCEREQQIKLRKVDREKASLERTVETLKRKSKYLLEEMAYLYKAHETLSKVQAMKPLDDVQAQQEYWNEKLTEELNLRLLLRNPLDSDFVKTILALEDTSPVKKQMVEILGKVQKNMIEDRDRRLALSEDTRVSSHKALLKKQGGK